MKPYETLILLYSIQALLKDGKYETAMDLINKIIESIEKS